MLTAIRTDSVLRRVVSGAAFTMAAKLAGAGAGFAFNVLLARQLGAEDYGHFSYALTIVAMLSVISVAGIDSVTIPFIPGYLVKQKWNLVSGLVRWVLTRATIVSGAFAACLVAVSVQPFYAVQEEEQRCLLIGIIIVICGALTVTEASILRSIRIFIAAELADAGAGLRSILSCAVLLVAVALGQHPTSAAQAMWISAFSALAALFWTTFVMFRSLPKCVRLRERAYESKEWSKIAIQLMLIGIVGPLQGQLDIIMLKHLSTTENVGVFFAASRLSSLVSFGIVSMAALVAPTVAELWALGRRTEVQKVIHQTSVVTSAVAVCVCVAGGLWGREALSLFGGKFVSGYLSLLILLATQCVFALAGNITILLVLAGHQAILPKAAIAAVVTNITLNFILIPPLGMEGAALTSLLSAILWRTIMNAYLFRRTGLHGSALSWVLSPSARILSGGAKK